MPATASTSPARGLADPAPWTSWMGVAGSPQAKAAAVPKVKAVSKAGCCAGRSWSVTWAAKTRTVQLASDGRSEDGLRVYTCGPPARVKPRLPAPQSMENAAGPAVTASLNVTTIGVDGATPMLPSAGTVRTTLGAASPPVNAWPVLHAPNVFGWGAAHTKSA